MSIPATNLYERAAAHANRNGYSVFDIVGFLPQFLDDESDWRARKQIDEAYAHGGGWRDFKGFTLHNPRSQRPKLTYPGDPPTEAVAYWKLPLTDELVILFDHAWVAVVAADDSFEIARID